MQVARRTVTPNAKVWQMQFDTLKSASSLKNFDAFRGRQGGYLTKLKAGTVAKGILRRVIHPAHLAKAANLHRHRKANRRNFDDLQLKLYSEILPEGFLHYGYFDDP